MDTLGPVVAILSLLLFVAMLVVVCITIATTNPGDRDHRAWTITLKNVGQPFVDALEDFRDEEERAFDLDPAASKTVGATDPVTGTATTATTAMTGGRPGRKAVIATGSDRIGTAMTETVRTGAVTIGTATDPPRLAPRDRYRAED